MQLLNIYLIDEEVKLCNPFSDNFHWLIILTSLSFWPLYASWVNWQRCFLKTKECREIPLLKFSLKGLMHKLPTNENITMSSNPLNFRKIVLFQGLNPLCSCFKSMTHNSITKPLMKLPKMLFEVNPKERPSEWINSTLCYYITSLTSSVINWSFDLQEIV